MTYQYNGLNQLTEILNKTSTDEILNQLVFTYNNLDLRGSETISGSALPAMPSLPEETRDYDYNTVNQLLSVTNPNLTFVYDDDGNMVQGYSPLEGGQGGVVPFTATYDAEDRMTSLEYTDSSSVVHRTEHQYSGDGFLAVIRKFENSSLVDEIRIVRDGFLAVQDRDENNTVEREYTWGLNFGGGIGGLLNLKQGGQDYSYLYDGKGNVAAVLDASQSVVAAYRYAPFGRLLAKIGSLTQPFGFSTKRYDPQTGLIHYQYRPYAPEIGRWLTRDPLGEEGGMNLYAFVGNNPVNWVDPWGLETILIFTTESKPPWSKAIAEYAELMARGTLSKKYESLDIETEDVNRVSQVSAALQKYKDIVKIVFITHSQWHSIHVGQDDAPDTNISIKGGKNDVHPNKLDWSNLTDDASIDIWGCNAAAEGKKSIAQSIANASGVPVTGATTYLNFVHTGPNTGRPFIRLHRKLLFGRWKTFTRK